MNDKKKTDAVWKYPLEIAGEQILTVPKHSKFCSLIEQNDKPALYFLVNDGEADTEDIVVFIRGTGHHVEREMYKTSQFIGTISTHSNQFVWHIWIKQ